MKCLLRKPCFRFYLSTFLSCLILVSIGVWLWKGRNTFLPFPWDPVTSRGSGSLRSSHGRGCTNTKHDRYTLDHVTRFGSRIYISKLPIMCWWTFLIIHILDPNFVTWSNVYLSYLVLVQPRPWLERSDQEPLEVNGSHEKGRNVFLPSNGYTPIETKMTQGQKVER